MLVRFIHTEALLDYREFPTISYGIIIIHGLKLWYIGVLKSWTIMDNLGYYDGFHSIGLSRLAPDWPVGA